MKLPKIGLGLLCLGILIGCDSEEKEQSYFSTGSPNVSFNDADQKDLVDGKIVVSVNMLIKKKQYKMSELIVDQKKVREQFQAEISKMDPLMQEKNYCLINIRLYTLKEMYIAISENYVANGIFSDFQNYGSPNTELIDYTNVDDRSSVAVSGSVSIGSETRAIDTDRCPKL